MSQAHKQFPDNFAINLIMGLSYAQTNKNKEAGPFLYKAVQITALLAQYSVKKAYFVATGKQAFRNAWRWLNRLVKQISTFRSFLQSRPKITIHSFQSKVPRFQILLPTLWQLAQLLNSNLCSSYQLQGQMAFI